MPITPRSRGARRCFIRGVNLSTGENEPIWQFGLFYGPVVFLVLSAVLLVGSSVVQLVKVGAASSPSHAPR